MKLLAFFILFFSAVINVQAEQSFEFSDFSVPTDGRIVLPMAEGDSLSELAQKIDTVTNGALFKALAEAEFKGEAKQHLTLLALSPFSRIDVIGVGKDSIDRVVAENFGGIAASLHGKLNGGEVRILWPSDGVEKNASAARVAFGYKLRSYRFDRYQAKAKKRKPAPKIILMSDDASAKEFTDDLSHLADGVYLARDMSSEPGNIIYPESFVARIKAQAKNLNNIKIKVLDEKDIQRLNMGALWAVGKGSSRPPRLLIMEYMAGGDAAPIVLAGKGITFDTGGISLKPNNKMWMMKGDLGGASVVSATVMAAARRGAPINVIAIAALAENMPSGTASRPGDVLTSMSGKTIEISSTDAEGRLVLSDALFYAQETYSPSVLINVATLTGSVGRALGDEYAGIFSRHDAIVDELMNAAKTAGEGVWRLPLDKTHFKQIESKVADIVNGGVGSPGASVGAAFLGSFVDEEQVWAHFDIASVDYYEKDRPTVPKGYSGWGVRTLDQYLRNQEAKGE